MSKLTSRAQEYVVKLTMKEAEMAGLVRCANCGFPPNNHWDIAPDKGSACAHAPCPQYEPKFRYGKAIK